MPAFVRFLTNLFESGSVQVPLINHGAPPDFQSLAASERLREADQNQRLAAPHTAPEFHAEAALAGARWLFLGCQLFIDRSHTIDAFSTEVSEGVLWEKESSCVYSVDLTLRFLPDLYRHARQHASNDPLMKTLQALAQAWPLSSVGIPDLHWEKSEWEPWQNHPSLRQIYIDRIIASDDGSRLETGRWANAVAESLGMYAHDLAGPNVLAALEAHSLTG